MTTRDSCVSRSPDETRALGARLGELLEPGDVVGLVGPLGSGKTCLVQGLARGLGVDPALPVTSPTYTLVGEYAGRVRLCHADFYRVESYARLFEAGFDDLLDGSAVVVVEWPERLPDALPRERLDVELAWESETARRLEVRATGARAGVLRRRWLEAWR